MRNRAKTGCHGKYLSPASFLIFWVWTYVSFSYCNLRASARCQALLRLHKALGVSSQLLKDSWINGRPIVELELFEGHYNQRASTIRLILNIILEEALCAKYYEIPFGDRYSDILQLETWKIDIEIMVGILDAADIEVKRQLDS